MTIHSFHLNNSGHLSSHGGIKNITMQHRHFTPGHGNGERNHRFNLDAAREAHNMVAEHMSRRNNQFVSQNTLSETDIVREDTPSHFTVNNLTDSDVLSIWYSRQGV